MRTSAIDPASVPATSGGYSQALRIEGASTLLVISGQIPVSVDGSVPFTFDAQCRLVWAHLLAVVEEAGLAVQNIAKVTTFLSDRRYTESNSAIRRDVLGPHEPALTVVITRLYDPAWLLEIEAIVAG